MNNGQSILNIIEKKKSCRTYDGTPLQESHAKDIIEYLFKNKKAVSADFLHSQYSGLRVYSYVHFMFLSFIV